MKKVLNHVLEENKTFSKWTNDEKRNTIFLNHVLEANETFSEWANDEERNTIFN